MRLKRLWTGLILAALIAAVIGAAHGDGTERRTRILLSGTDAKIIGGGAYARADAIEIVDGGAYEISGEGALPVIVDADKRAEIEIILNGASIACADGAAVFIRKAGAATLILAENTENTLISGTKSESAPEDAEGGALTSKCDLTIDGGGRLFVGGYLHNGIHGSDSLAVRGGAIRVEAARHGLKGKDSLAVIGGTIDVNAGQDGLHSEGAIAVGGGETLITAADDGAHADQSLEISSGRLEVLASLEGLEATHVLISGGDVTVCAEDDGVNASGGASDLGRGNKVRTDAKKSADDLTADPIPQRNEEQGKPADGSPADPIPQQNEAQGKPADGSPADPIPQQNEAQGKPTLRITGGSLYVNAKGDGLDSNGDLLVEGGTVLVDGPENRMDGALDSGSENGGVCRINGGTALAIGAMGMAESFDESSAQCAFCWETEFAAGDEIVLTDENGNEIIRHTAARNGGSVVFSSPELKQGGRYTLKIGEKEEIIEMTEANVTNSKNFFANPRGFGMGDSRKMPEGGNPPDKPDGEPPFLPDDEISNPPNGEAPNPSEGMPQFSPNGIVLY